VEVKRNTYGIGAQYWEKTEEEKEREREKSGVRRRRGRGQQARARRNVQMALLAIPRYWRAALGKDRKRKRAA